ELDAFAARAELRDDPGGGEQVVERGGPAWRNEVAREGVRRVVVVLAQDGEEALLGGVAGGQLHEEGVQRPVPPADLVVGEVADAVRVAPVGRHQLGGGRTYAGLG